jgi:hypothetical protein
MNEVRRKVNDAEWDKLVAPWRKINQARSKQPPPPQPLHSPRTIQRAIYIRQHLGQATPEETERRVAACCARLKQEAEDIKDGLYHEQHVAAMQAWQDMVDKQIY